MPALKTYDLFLSHAWRYDDDYLRMVELLKGTNHLSWRNYSVPKADPCDANSESRLKEALRNQIRPANIVIILAGIYCAHSPWINWEIEYAQHLRKPIIGVRPHGNVNTPAAVSNAAIEVVGWNTDSVVAAIRKYSL